MRHFTIVQGLFPKQYSDSNIDSIISIGKELLKDTESGTYAEDGEKDAAIEKALWAQRDLISLNEHRAAIQMAHLAVVMQNAKKEITIELEEKPKKGKK